MWSWFLNICRFFAGGSERSGQQIVGPPKKKSSNEVVEDLFKGAKEHGAVPLDRSGKGPVDSRKHHVWNFYDYFLLHSKSVLVESVDSYYCRCFSWPRPSLVEVTGLAQLLKSRHMLLQRSKPPTANRMWVHIRLCLFCADFYSIDAL